MIPQSAEIITEYRKVDAMRSVDNMKENPRDDNSSSTSSFFTKMGIRNNVRQGTGGGSGGVEPRSVSQNSQSRGHSRGPGTHGGADKSMRVTYYEDEMRKEELQHVAAINTLEFVIDDPIAIGFLKFFCELQFNVENIYFVVEVSKLRDMFAVDKNAWSGKDWKTIDAEVGLASLPSAQVSHVQQHLHELQHKKILWPSTIVNRNEVEQRVLWMWSVFFSPTGTHEICVPHTVLQNTIKRIFLLHIYGPRAFEEALIDPLKTLKRDIYPRFAVSELATEMRSRLQSLRVLPPANLLTVAPPANTPFCSRIESDESVDDFIATIELAQVLSDRVLFESFLAYLQSIVSSENLLCVRMIEIFKELTPETDPSTKTGKIHTGLTNYYRFESVNQAWLIYLYFVQPGAAYEVALSHRRRKDIRLAMANPTNKVFDRLEKSAMDAVRVHFTNFKNSVSLKTKLRSSILAFREKQREDALAALRAQQRLNSCCGCSCLPWFCGRGGAGDSGKLQLQLNSSSTEGIGREGKQQQQGKK
jgi:hypothetical protein